MGYVSLLQENQHSILKINSIPVLNLICQEWSQIGDYFLRENDQERSHSKNKKNKIIVLNRSNKM